MIIIPLRKKFAIGLAMYLPSIIKIFIYKLLGADIGKNVRIGLGSYIFAEKIVLKDGAVIGNGVHILCKGIVVDEEAIIGEEARIDGESTCTLGKGCYIGPRAYINVSRPVVLEDDVGMGGHIYTHGVWPSYMDGYPRKFEGVTIKRGAWIPPDTTILPGVTIGEEAMIGAGAVVTKSIPSRAFAVGVPAKVIRSVDDIQITLDANQRDARFKEIINDFREWIEDVMVIENNTVGDIKFALIARMKRLLKVKRWGVYYTTDQVALECVQKLFSLKNQFARIIVVTLEGFDQELLGKLAEMPELRGLFVCINLKFCSCSGSEDAFVRSFRHFLRSHYGVRLRAKK